MLIIIEGCDGTGKTTFAEAVTAELRSRGRCAQLVHKGPPTAHPLHEYERELELYYGRDLNADLVCDRWHWGELIYGPLYRGASKLQQPGRRHVDLLLQKLGAVIVFCTQSPEVILERNTRNGEDYLAPADTKRVWAEYEAMAINSPLPPFIFKDPNDEDQWMNVRVVITQAHADAVRVAELQAFRTYVGPPRPKLLLLGDRHGNPREPSQYHDACFVPYRTSSGHFLMSALPERLLRQQQIGMANANQEDVLALWTALGQPRVVALGNDAMSTARAALRDVAPIGKVAHPQFVRRFFHDKGHEYGRLIVAAALDGTNLSQMRERA